MNIFHQAFVWLNDPLNWTNPGGIEDRLREHLLISLASVNSAVLIAVPIGLWAGHRGRGAGGIVALSNMTRAIPTYGLLVVFVCTGLGLGAPSVIPALTIFAIPPVLANVYTGMREVDPEAKDAARGMGMSSGQVLRRVELPLATPYIATGIRVAAVQVVATTTLGALAGGGGLGTIIATGFELGLVAGGGEIVAGGLLVLVLALLVNILSGVATHYATPPPLREHSGWWRRRTKVAKPDEP